MKSILIFLAIPGPPVDWLLRHEVNEYSDSMDQIVVFRTKWQKRYPRICRYFMGPIPCISIGHPESFKEIVKHKTPKHYLYKTLFSAWLGDGLLLACGSKWFRHRRMVTPAFHFNILRSFMSIYTRAITVMLHQWEEAMQKDGCIALQDSIPYLSLDILLQCIGSLETNCQIEKKSNQYVRDVQDLTEISMKRYANPIYILDWYFYLTEDGRKFRRACSRSRSYVRDLILQRRQALIQQSTISSSNVSSERKNDFLSILLTTTDENGKNLTEQEICDEVNTFVFEGHDTTATGLIWVLYYLAKCPKYQEMCRNEVLECVGESELKLEDLARLEFITMFIKETLRLRPPVYGIIRQTDHPMTIDDYKLPKGTYVQMPIYQLHWNSEFWPDPFIFDPYRFSSENISKMDPYAYLPFSVGERNCIGQNLAMHEIKSVVCMVVRKYEIGLHPSISDIPISIRKDILFKPKTSIKLCLREITF